jgi:hypothetical protein
LPQLLGFLGPQIGERGAPSADLHEATALGKDGGVLVHVGIRSISTGIAALAMGFALGLLGTHGVGPAYAGLGAALATRRQMATMTLTRSACSLMVP